MGQPDTAPNMLLAMTAATAGVLLIILTLALERWWLLVPAVAAHGLAAAVLLGYVGRQADDPPEREAAVRERVREERSGYAGDLRTEPDRIGERVEH